MEEEIAHERLLAVRAGRLRYHGGHTRPDAEERRHRREERVEQYRPRAHLAVGLKVLRRVHPAVEDADNSDPVGYGVKVYDMAGVPVASVAGTHILCAARQSRLLGKLLKTSLE
jgi:hypothetical protein